MTTPRLELELSDASGMGPPPFISSEGMEGAESKNMEESNMKGAEVNITIQSEAKESISENLSYLNIKKSISYLTERHKSNKRALLCTLGSFSGVPFSYFMAKEAEKNEAGAVGYMMLSYLGAAHSLVLCICAVVLLPIWDKFFDDEEYKNMLSVINELAISPSSSTRALLAEFRRLFPTVTDEALKKGIETRKKEVFYLGLFDKRPSPASSLTKFSGDPLFDKELLSEIAAFTDETPLVIAPRR